MTDPGRCAILWRVHENLPPWAEYVGRSGQFAKGCVYFCIGLFSASAAWDGHARASDSRGVIETIAAQPFGRVLLVVLIAGLACYILWRLLEAFLDAARRGTDAKGLILRARSFGIALIYGGITFSAVRLLLGASGIGGGGNRAAQSWTARVMETPFGTWTVILIGAGMILGGCYKAWRAWRGKFKEKLAIDDLFGKPRQWLLRISAFGICARGVVFILAGAFLIQAGLESNPGQARGLSGALDSLRDQPHGRWLFGITAVGLAAYGLYSLLRSRYGRFPKTARARDLRASAA